MTTWMLWVSAAWGQGRMRVMFYNTENLFDCAHDSLKNDGEFLPDGVRHWSPWRYWQKVDDVARVIAAVGESSVPELVGLCEVENDSVMRDLCHRSLLRVAGYQYVMTHGDDPRGVDVALLYKPSHYHVLTTAEYVVPVRSLRPDAHARPVLHVSGELLNGDTLDVLVCHWPSKVGGRRHSEPLRRLAADVVRHVTDSLTAVRGHASIVVMGDMNETPREEAVQGLTPALTNVTAALPGSYRYRGRWEQLDQMLVSPQLVEGTASCHVPIGASVVRLPHLLEKDPLYGGWRPRRTYQGRRYRGGVSDHLPIVMTLELTE